MRILVVEPDDSSSRIMEIFLNSAGHHVEIVTTAEEAIEYLELYPYDIVLTEIDLPDMSGIRMVRKMRTQKIVTPVLCVSQRSDVETKVQALQAGSDGYITKPYHRDELSGVIAAIIRRSAGHASPSIRVGELEILTDERRVLVSGKGVHLTGKEYQIMELLALRKGVTLSKEQFINHLYGGRDEPEQKIVDVFVCKLRKKLGQGGLAIATVWGRGYVLQDPARAAAA